MNCLTNREPVLDFVANSYIFGALGRTCTFTNTTEIGIRFAANKSNSDSIRRFAMAANTVPRPEELTLEPEKRESEIFVRATGRVTSSTSAKFENALRDLVSGNKRVVLDLTSVDYIDSSGLGSLVAVYMHASRSNCELELANPRTRIRDLFSRSGLASVFSKVQEAGARHNELLGMTPD
jgi:anti-sigma B factor antagonist